MMSSVRFLPVCFALWLCLSSQIQAQGLRLPQEAALNRLGLTMSWWAQAGVKPTRDRVEFFTVDEQNVFVQSTTGIVTSFHAELGKRLWSHLIGIPEQQSYPVTTSDQEVVVTIGLHLHSLRKDTGKKVWELVVKEYPSTSPEVTDENIFVGTIDGSVLAYDLSKVRSLYTRGMLPQWTERAFLWNFQTPELIISPPIPFDRDVVFASRRGIVYSLKDENKVLNYQLETGNSIRTPLGYSRDRVFVSDRYARMLCLNAKTGQVQWTFAGGSTMPQQPRVIGDSIYLAPRHEGLISLAVQGGIFQWRQPRASAFIAASETRVYARDESKNLLVLDRGTGQLIGTMDMRNFALHVENDRTDRIFLASTDGAVVALREMGSEYPVYHLHPERRPILPEFSPEDGEESTETTSDDASSSQNDNQAEENQNN